MKELKSSDPGDTMILHLSVLRGNRADTSTLQGFLKILRRRFGIREAVFVFDGGMSSKISGETGEVTRILRELQTIRLGQISLGKPGAPFLARLTKVTSPLNALLSKLNPLPLFAAPPKWAAFPSETQM